MRGLTLPFAIVFVPQMALATIQHGMGVLAPAVTQAAGLPPEAVGLIGGLAGLGSVWLFAASGAVIPVMGAVRALILACLLGAGAAALFLTAQPAVIFLAAPLAGFAYGITAPAGSQLLARHIPKRLWGTAFSLRMAGVPAGGAIAGIAGAGLAASVAWQAGLVAILLPALAGGLFLTLRAGAFREAGRTHWPRLAALLTPRNLAQPFATLQAMPGLPLLAFASLGFAAAQASSFVFLTTYLTDGLGLSLALAGSLFATMQVASFLGRIGIGLVADRVGSVRWVLVILGLASAIGVLALAQARADMPVSVLFAGAAAIGASVATWNGLFLAEVARAAGDGDVAAATSAATFFTFIGYATTPPAFAALALGLGYRTAYLSAAVCVLVAAAALAWRRG